MTAISRRSAPGVDVLTARHGGTGQVSLALYRPRNDREGADTAGRAMLAVRTMLRGTRRLDAGALAFAAESLGAVISPSIGVEFVGFGMMVLADDLVRAARLLVELFAEPRFDPRVIAVERRVLVDDSRAAADDMASYPFRLAFGVAFDDRGYGSPLVGTPESVETLDAASAQAWHREWMTHGPLTAIAVGDADPDRMADALLPIVQAIAAPPAMAAATSSSVWRAGRRVVERMRQQSALALVFPGPSRRSPERFAAEVWAAVAGGLGGRLFESLRSERSLAYTVRALSWQRRDAGALGTYIACAPERLTEAREAMLAELARFAAEPPSDDEVARATEMLAGQAEMSRQTAGELAGEIADAWLVGNGLEELEEPAAPYRAVTAGPVRELARNGFQVAGMAEGAIEATGSASPTGR